MYMNKQTTYKKEKPISATKLRDSLFTSLDDVYFKRETLVVEKSGIPIAYIVSPKDYEATYVEDKFDEEFFEAVKATKGIWANDTDFEKDMKKRKRIELAAAKKRRKEW